MSKCTIFAGGEMKNFSCVNMSEVSESFVICADRGYEYAKKLGVVPDLILGDFDSLGFIPEENSKVCKFPCQKDDTDLMLAVRYAIENNMKQIVIYGALGGRLDHTIGNIQVLAFISQNGGTGKIISENEECSVLFPGKYLISAKEGFSLSLFSYSEKVTGLTIRGAEYTLENGKITNSFPIGISNSITAENCEISFESGKILIIQSKLCTDF